MCLSVDSGSFSVPEQILCQWKSPGLLWQCKSGINEREEQIMKVLWWYVRNSALYSSQAIKEMTEAKVVTWKSPVSKAVGITDEVTMANAVFPTRSQNRSRCICFWKFIWQIHAEHLLCSVSHSKVFYVSQLFRSAQVLWAGYYYYFHFTFGENEAQKSYTERSDRGVPGWLSQ